MATILVLPMRAYFNPEDMVQINFNHLNREAQDRLLKMARQQVEENAGEAIREYCATNGIDYNEMMEEESIKKLYTYEYIFKI